MAIKRHIHTCEKTAWKHLKSTLDTQEVVDLELNLKIFQQHLDAFTDMLKKNPDSLQAKMNVDFHSQAVAYIKYKIKTINKYKNKN